MRQRTLSLVIELRISESLARLLVGAFWWLTNLGGEVLVVAIKPVAQRQIETWGLWGLTPRLVRPRALMPRQKIN